LRRLARIVFLTMLGIVLGAGGLAWAQEGPLPPLPAAYYGAVKNTAGSPVAAGTVQAYIEGQKRGELAFQNGIYGGPEGIQEKLIVQGPSEILGKEVTFKVVVGSQVYPATSTPAVIMTEGDVKKVDLTIDLSAPLPVPPEVTTTDPSVNAAGVPVDKTVRLTFSKSVQPGTAYEQVTLTGAQNVAVNITKSISGNNTLILQPAANLAFNTQYTVKVPEGAVKDADGNPNTPYSYSFTTVSQSSSSGTQPGGETTGAVATPQATPAPGSYVKNVSISLSCTTAGAIIYYTLDGSDPKTSAGRQKYTAPLTLTATTTVKAVALKDSTYSAASSFVYTITAEGTPGPGGGGTVGQVSFSDLPAGHWAKDTVAQLVYLGIIKGYEDNTFRPAQKINRVEVVAIMSRALKLEACLACGDAKLLDQFSDKADIPAWATWDCAAALKKSLVKGYPEEAGKLAFKPNRSITRAELASLLARAIRQQVGPVQVTAASFADAGQIPAWAKEDIELAAAKGIIKGYPDQTFRANQEVTRAETAAMVLRCLNLLKG